ncbi:60S ribosomal L36-2-like [Olea europaea subsp. europaea]|uniref:60S ribosomal L36-2-like n=1 Tax=Olea europaea subsp. europaea TaxID=158383 RepID=A0A8S0VM83_OLEEU|nr:60S ribosomal L36-2-like [Olea europaea subsp. europaea]
MVLLIFDRKHLCMSDVEEKFEENDDGELAELEDTKDEEGDDTKAPVSKFAGKKKGKAKKDGSNNALSASSFGLLGEGDDEDNEDSGITKRILIMKNQDAEVAGFAPCEKQITELLKVGKDERAPKAGKRKLGTHKRAKKREKMAFVLRNMR